MLVDSHCHLDFPDFAEELDDVVRRAGTAGVATMLTISTKVREFERILRLAERFENIWCSVGLHPHEAAAEPELTTERLVELAGHAKVIGIGETGLDYYYEHSPRERQQESFRAHIAAARQTALPLIVHTRDADDDTLRILQEEMEKGVFPGLIHCFSTGRKLADISMEFGFYISVSGIVTFRSAKSLRESVSALPLDRLLVETDAPYLAPVPFRGKRNEPAFVAHVAAEVAMLKDIPGVEVEKATTDNFFRLFGKAVRPSCG